MAAFLVLGAAPAAGRPDCSKACVERVKHRIQKRIRHQHRVSRSCGTPACNRRLGHYMTVRRYGAGAWSCVYPIIDQESGWDATIRFGGEHGYVEGPAYGIPQALPGSKMASAGPRWMTDARTQIRWFFSYVDGRYGGPCGALSHKRSTGWY